MVKDKITVNIDRDLKVIEQALRTARNIADNAGEAKAQFDEAFQAPKNLRKVKKPYVNAYENGKYDGMVEKRKVDLMHGGR